MKPPPYFSISEPQCRLSDPAQPHKLCRRRRRSHGPLSICFSCKGKHLEGRKYYYYCATCKLEFHRGCHLLPPVLRHPFHPSHLLTLISLPPGFDISKIPRNTDDGSAASERSINETDDDDDSEDGGHDDEDNNFVDDDVIINDGDGVGEDRDGDSDGDGDGGDDDDDDDDDDFQQDIYYRVNGYDYYYNNYDDGDNAAYASISDGNDHRKCKCCQDPLKKVHYHCSICKFNLNLSCSMRPPPPTISHLKSHEHTLTLFPIRLPSPCDACGLSLSDTKDLIYACLPCSHMVHRSCIYLPRVIQITRHPHRLSLTSSLQVGDFSCGVCRQTVDINYGHYSCNKGCNYAVHSKCATREDVWDGKDLEGVPEKPDEDIEPFVRIDEETIKHFSHDHYLKLHEKKTVREKDKFCEACTLPVMISQRYYGCTECDFVLDEACASLPRKIYNPLHKHPLTLQPFPIDETSNIADNISTKGIFECDGCHRLGCGFVYRCSKRKCVFRLDVRCASLPDPFIHDCHPHDLFFNLTKGNCIGCGSDECSSYFLECIKCNSFLGIRCASLPFEAHYKHDRHPLILCRDEDTSSGLYWCEICESELDPKTWFYTCDFCTITLHVNCLLGKDMYMKPQYIFKIGYRHRKVEIARNDGNSRLFCTRCKRHCMQNLIYKRIGRDQSYCTLKCFGARLMLELF
ncbi:putative chromatin regulator PHD family [Arabidopsis thaliana]